MPIPLAPSTDLAAWSALVVAVLTASARVMGTYGKVRAQGDDTLWKRRDQMLDDYRSEIERYRTALRDRDVENDRIRVECDSLRRQRDDCWRAMDRRQRPRDKPRGGAS